MMKKITLLLVLLTSTIIFGQNLLTNGDFETGDVDPWTGYKNQVVTDDITSSLCGNINNGDGSLIQTFTVTPDETYNVTFNYRWVLAGGTDMTARVKDGASGGSDLGTFVLATTVDTWHTDGAFSFTAPGGISTVRIIFFKANGNSPLRIDDVSVVLNAVASRDDLEQFGFKSYPNPANDYINLSAVEKIDQIEVYNLLGQKVLQQKDLNNTTRVDISNLTTGIYIMKVAIEDSIGSFKFIKE